MYDLRFTILHPSGHLRDLRFNKLLFWGGHAISGDLRFDGYDFKIVTHTNRISIPYSPLLNCLLTPNKKFVKLDINGDVEKR